MHTLEPGSDETSYRSTWVNVVLAILSFLGRVLRLVIFAPLAIVEPVIRVVLSTLSLLGFLTCVVFKLAGHGHHFPFGLMIGFSVSCAVLLVLYYMLMRALAP